MMVEIQDDRAIKMGTDCPSDCDSKWCYVDTNNDVYVSCVDLYEDGCGLLVIFDSVTGDRNINALRPQPRERVQRAAQPLLVAYHPSLVPPH